MEKTKKPIKSYIMSSVSLLGLSLLFSLMGLIFLSDKIYVWVQVLLGFVFMAPIIFMALTIGKSSGEALYKKCTKNSLADIHNQQGGNLPIYKCVYHLIGYGVPLLILAILSFVTKNTVIHFILALFTMPITLIFSSTNFIVITALNWAVLVTYVPYILIVCGMFVLGFMLRIKKLREQQKNIEGELRMFNN